MEGVKTTHRMFNVLWNVYRFPLPYMQLDNYTPAADAAGAWDPAVVEEHIAEFGREDRWLVSRVNSLAGGLQSSPGNPSDCNVRS